MKNHRLLAAAGASLFAQTIVHLALLMLGVSVGPRTLLGIFAGFLTHLVVLAIDDDWPLL